jgi:signal transduction histidine kinase
MHSWKLLADAVALCETRAHAAKQLQAEMDDQRRRAEESEALHTLGLATNRTLALDEVLDLVARFTRSLMGAHYALVSTKDDDGFKSVAHVGLNGEMPERDAFALHAIEAQKPVVLVADESNAAVLSAHAAEGIKVGVGIPLTLFGETFGALVVGYRRTYAPTPRDIRLAMSVAQHASVAISNAKLHARVEERSVELADAYKQLEELTHAKERFYNAISHDLRTPVGAIRGYSDLLLDGLGGDLPPDARKFVERTRRASEALLDLVNDLLDFAKLQAGRITVKKRECNLNEIIDDAVNAVSPQAAEKGLSIATDLQTDQPINTDPERVRQILVNLLSNAVKFTKSGGVTVSASFERDFIGVKVQDTGPGIPLEYQEKIFVEFEQVPGSAGTGLGLPIARNLAELLGGCLSLRSESGLGSTFTLQLPVLEA